MDNLVEHIITFYVSIKNLIIQLAFDPRISILLIH
jgi:hypothetical protein